MIKYGLISQVDAYALERTLDLIMDEFWNEAIEFTEIGIYSGKTGYGINRYFASKKIASWWNGIDNRKDGQPIVYYPDRFIEGNSSEVYNQLNDYTQHLIFVDGDHSLIGVISDFYAYKDKIKIGGYIAFHDTGKHIKPFKDFQHGDRANPDAYISVRKALNKIKLLHDNDDFAYDVIMSFKKDRWELVFDEADETDEAGGICVFRKTS